MAVIKFPEQDAKDIEENKRYQTRNFLEVMDKTMSDPVEKQIIRETFLNNINKYHRFVLSIVQGTRNARFQSKHKRRTEKHKKV